MNYQSIYLSILPSVPELSLKCGKSHVCTYTGKDNSLNTLCSMAVFRIMFSCQEGIGIGLNILGKGIECLLYC